VKADLSVAKIGVLLERKASRSRTGRCTGFCVERKVHALIFTACYSRHMFVIAVRHRRRRGAAAGLVWLRLSLTSRAGPRTLAVQHLALSSRSSLSQVKGPPSSALAAAEMVARGPGPGADCAAWWSRSSTSATQMG
jgi:hypothetical protein